MRDGIVDELKAYEPELIEIRRDIHRHPETGFEETRTAKIVADRLRSWGIDVVEGVARTGVVGTLTGKRPGQRAIGLRADLDALNIREIEGRDHRSTVPGKMHACGTTAIPQCCSAQRGISPKILTSAGVCTSSSSPPRRGWAAAS
jgi:metal-dependent amidase/aminoacylase/carboxypeptidase family protein